ncbi:MAG: hypothetical protein PUK73_03515, partial [Spirochaetota bacterium]|uniref:hypothetical protein n=1 Tax=Candidatus Avelusimicrobium faecicola TaxID=3416205 RepID=UPI002A5EED0D|nr:hypothetical protein [Spirochaetota bacterium]
PPNRLIFGFFIKTKIFLKIFLIKKLKKKKKNKNNPIQKRQAICLFFKDIFHAKLFLARICF